MAHFARKSLKLKSAALISIEDEYGASYEEAFSNAFESKGGKVLLKETFFKTDNDFRSQLLKIKNSNSELLYITGYDTHIINILKQAHQIKLPATLMSSWVIASPEIRKANEELLEGVYLTTSEYYLSKRRAVIDFKDEFHSKFNRKPSSYAAIACDTVRLIDKAAGAQHEDVLSNLKAIQNYPGIMGILSVDKDGEIRIPLEAAVIRSGKLHTFH